MSHSTIPRRLLLLLAALIPAAIVPCVAQQHPDEFDLDALARSVRDLTDLRTDVLSAMAHDTNALHRLLALSATDHATDPVYPALLWSLLISWGDSTFASRIRAEPEGVRSDIVGQLDRGSGVAYPRTFPSTWAIGSHSRSLLPVEPAVVSADTGVEPERIYPIQDVSRRPGVVQGSCAVQRYPSGYLDRQLSGRVVMEIVIDSAGHLVRSLLRSVSATQREFADAAERIARSCDYSPGRVNGRVVQTRLWLPFEFAPPWVVLHRSRLRFFYTQDIQRQTTALGIEVARLITAAEHDTAALRMFLGIPARVGRPRFDAPSYPAIAGALAQTWGDSAFTAVARGARREELGAALPYVVAGLGGGDTTAFPQLRALARQFPSPPEPRSEPTRIPAKDTEVVALLALSAVVPMILAEQKPAVIPGSCRSPRYPSYSGRTALMVT